MKFIGERLRTKLNEPGWSTPKLVKEIKKIDPTGGGLSQSSISDYVTGQIKNPKPEKVDLIAKALGVPNYYFYDLTEAFEMIPAKLKTDEFISFLLQQENVPFLLLAQQIRKKGIPLRVIEGLVDGWPEVH